jgi:hypothetical protein
VERYEIRKETEICEYCSEKWIDIGRSKDILVEITAGSLYHQIHPEGEKWNEYFR